jgi:glycosyltransferase involved in cell wall biosynthesis
VSRLAALIVTGRMPWPLDDGGRIGLWQFVRSLATVYDTTLVSLAPLEHAAAPVPVALTALGIRTIILPHRPPRMPVALLRGTFGRWPYMLARYRNPGLDAKLRELVAKQRFAFAILNHLHLATYLDALNGVPVVLREHNVEHLLLKRYAESIPNPVARMYARTQTWRMRRTEAALCARCDMVLAVQEAEAGVLRRLAPGARVEVIPVGIDFSNYLPRAPKQPPVVLLAGSWEWPPNAEGAMRFLENGWGRLRERFPEARLRVVGKRPAPALVETARRSGAEMVGYVEDMAPEFAGAAAMVVPLWVGAGSRVKIVEALAARLPVVTTSLGAEGLGLEPGTHAVFAETPEGLADGIADLLARPELGRALAEAGYGFAWERFSFERVASRTVELCESVVESRRTSP